MFRVLLQAPKPTPKSARCALTPKTSISYIKPAIEHGLSASRIWRALFLGSFLDVFDTLYIFEMLILCPEGGVVCTGGCKNNAVCHR